MPHLTLSRNPRGRRVRHFLLKRAIVYAASLLLPTYLVAETPRFELSKASLQGECNPSISHFPDTTTALVLSTDLRSEHPFAFQTGYDQATWSGSLKKLAITQNRDDSITISSTPEWDAGQLLNLQSPVLRHIYTYDQHNAGSVEFQYASLNPADIGKLNNHGAYSNDVARRRIQYLRGDRSMEGMPDPETNQNFRIRSSVLGDIINSSPVYQRPPINSTNQTASQSVFNRTRMNSATVYVGANDGMLHAFDGNDGQEVFSYIPSPLIDKLALLTNESYSKVAFVDGKIEHSDAKVGGRWKSVLVSGMGAGAQGIFALDVTPPQVENFQRGRGVIFEFTEQDDPDIGFITSTPHIIKIYSEKNKLFNKESYFVAVSSGANSTDSNYSPGSNNDSYLYLLSLDKNPKDVWRLNSNYYKLKAGSSNIPSPNILTAPSFVFNAQNEAVYAYAGDLQGTIWRFNFNGATPTTIAPVKLFSAKDKNDRPQAITSQPAVVFAPGGGYLILVGTGTPANPESVRANNGIINSFYALRDLPRENAIPKNRSELAERKLTNVLINRKYGVRISGESFQYGEAENSKKGWYIDFDNAKSGGELIQQEATVVAGNVLFNSTIPGTALCQASSGKSYMVNILTGLTDNRDSITGISTPRNIDAKPIFLSNTNTTTRNSKGTMNSRQQYYLLNFQRAGIGNSIEPTIDITTTSGRLSWREIENWANLKK